MSIIYEMVIARDERRKINRKCMRAIDKMHKKLNLNTHVDYTFDEDPDFVNGKTDIVTIVLTGSEFRGDVALYRDYARVRESMKILSMHEIDVVNTINDSISPYVVDNIAFKKTSIKIKISEG